MAKKGPARPAQEPAPKASPEGKEDAAAPSRGSGSRRLWPVLAVLLAVSAGAWWRYASNSSAVSSFAENARVDFLELPSNGSVAERIDPAIFLMWTTPASTYRARNAAVLDSYLYHHPRSTITIYASHLTADFFARYTDAGYDVRVVRLDDELIMGLGKICPGQSWLANLTEWKKGPYFYSHITDYLRFCLLYAHGGVYSDFDAILLQPLDIATWGPSFIGKDRVRSHGSHADCLWCLPGGLLYLAPGVMGSAPRGDLVREALKVAFERKYDPSIFNAVGPRAVTIASRSLPSTATMPTLLETHVLYPYSYWEVGPIFNATGNSKEDAAKAAVKLLRLSRTSTSLHLYGHMSKTLAIQPGSLVSKAVNAIRIFPDDYAMNRTTTRASDPLQWPHAPDAVRLVGPEYAGVGKPVVLIEGVRFIPPHRLRKARFELRVQVSAGAAAVAGKHASGDWRSLFAISGLSAAEVNDCLSQLHFRRAAEEAEAIMSVSILSDSLSTPLSHAIRLLNLRPLVTIMIKTFDRIDRAFRLVSSIRDIYPDIRIVVADDGEEAQRFLSAPGASRGIHRRDFLFLPLPYDVGLSAGRNRMLELVTTPFFLTLDDDFFMDGNSRLEHLLFPVLTGQLDIAAGKNPRDEAAYGFDFCGKMMVTREDDTMHLVGGNYGSVAGCDIVDIVPNLFVGSVARVRQVGWDDELKLGEHEDFFWRAKLAGLRVGSCPLTSFLHGQEPSWQGGAQSKYNTMRRRIYDFWRISLEKHGLRKLKSFGNTMMISQPPSPVVRLAATEVLSRSARISWEPQDEATKFKVSYYAANDKSTVTVISPESYIESTSYLLGALLPDTTYVVQVYSGHFLFETKGAKLILHTATDDEAKGALVNYSFERGMVPWVGGLGTVFHTVSSSALSGTLSGRLQIHAAAQLSSTPSVMVITQTVMVGRPLGGVLLSAHSLLEQMFGNAADITYEARVKVFYRSLAPNSTDDEFVSVSGSASFSPYTNSWQAVSVHLGLSRQYVAHHVEVSLVLGGYRGSAVFDHIILQLLDIEGPAKFKFSKASEQREPTPLDAFPAAH